MNSNEGGERGGEGDARSVWHQHLVLCHQLHQHWNGMEWEGLLKEEFKKAEGLVALKKQISNMWNMSPHQKIIVQKECGWEESSRVERLQVFAEMEMVLFDS